MQRCPSPEQLREFLDDQLSGADRTNVGRHVDGCQACQRLLDRLSTAPLPFPARPLAPGADFLRKLKQAEPAPTLTQTVAPGPGPTSLPAVPGFEVLGELGRGGMGVVYKARQVGLNRLVALKLLLAGARASAETRARFRTEAEAVARLQHPNIVQVFEIGEHEGQPYFALELVEGGSLACQLDGTPQPLAVAASLVEALARAIQVAHENGIVHRDLKPANVLLSAACDLAGCVPKITDFGLAKLLNGEADLTRTGDVLGTPSYLAPEQAAGDSRSLCPGRGIGPATDIYALGAILYELLAGRPPFKAETPMETVLQVVHQEPVPPSRLQPKVPRDLATICLKCLEKGPAKRYASATALAEDLRRYRAGEPILARRVNSLGRLWRWSWRRPVLAGLTAALLLSLVGGLAGMTVLWRLAEQNRHAAEESALMADRRREEAEAAHEGAAANLYFSRLAQARLAWRLNDAHQARHLLDQCSPRAGEADLRGWEWQYLKALTEGELATISTDHHHVENLAFSPDGQRLLVGGGSPYIKPGGALQVWDLAPLRREGGEAMLRRTLSASGDMVFSLAQSPDGQLLASGERNGTVNFWDAQTGRLRRAGRGHRARVFGLAFSPDGGRLVSIDAGGEIKVWDVRNGTVQFELKGSWASFGPDGKHLLTAPPAPAGKLAKWDATDGRALGSLPFAATRWAFSPDGTALVAWNGREVRILDGAGGQVVTVLSGHSGDVRAAAFSPDGLHIATASSDQTVRLWDARTGAEELLLRGHTSRVSCLAFHPSGRYLVSGSQQPGDIKVWDLTRPPEFLRAGGVPNFPRGQQLGLGRGHALALGLTANGQRLARAYQDQTVQVCDARGGPGACSARWVDLTREWLVPATVAAFSADGQRLAGVHRSAPNRVVVWDTATGQEVLALRGHTVPVYHVGWSRDGRRLVTAGNERDKTRCRREVKVWDALSGAALADFQPGGYSKSVDPRLFGVAALSANGEQVAFDDYRTEQSAIETRVKVCAVHGGRELHTLIGQEGPPAALAFDADGRHLAVGSWHSPILVHDLASPSSPIVLGPVFALGALAFSPDGRLLAAVDRDQVKVWHVRWKQEVLVLRGAPPRTTDNAFNPRLSWAPDGRCLAALNHDRSISLWGPVGPSTSAARFQAAEERAFGWHLAHAQAAVRGSRHRFGAEFHNRALKALTAPNEELRRERGVLWAWQGRWKEAAADYGAHALESPADAFERALLCLRAGDRAGWRRACAHLREYLDRAPDPLAVEYLARACQLAPGAWSDPAQLVQIAEGAPRSEWRPLLLGAAHYRTGKYREAIRHCEAVARAERNQELATRAWAFLALAHGRSGQTEPARQWLARLEKWSAEQEACLSGEDRGAIPPTVDWRHWVEIEVLLREAKEVLGATGRPQHSSPAR